MRNSIGVTFVMIILFSSKALSSKPIEEVDTVKVFEYFGSVHIFYSSEMTFYHIHYEIIGFYHSQTFKMPVAATILILDLR